MPPEETTTQTQTQTPATTVTAPAPEPGKPVETAKPEPAKAEKSSLIMDPTSLIENLELKNSKIKDLESRLGMLQDSDNIKELESKINKHNTYLNEIAKTKFESNKEYFSDFINIDDAQWKSDPLAAVEYMDKLTDLHNKILTKIRADEAQDPTRSKVNKEDQLKLETELDYKAEYYDLVKNGVKKPK